MSFPLSIWFEKYKVVFIGIGVLCLIFFHFLLFKEDEQANALQPPFVVDEKVEEEKNEDIEEHITYYVDVKGAVKRPGLYEASPGERVYDIIIRAGGFLETADEKQINLAMKIEDEMVIYVPSIGEREDELVQFSGLVSNQQNKININKASQEELMTLPGIGPSKASAIIEYREQNGAFQNIEEIKNISGIGEKTFEKLKDHIRVK